MCNTGLQMGRRSNLSLSPDPPVPDRKPPHRGALGFLDLGACSEPLDMIVARSITSRATSPLPSLRLLGGR